MASVTSKHRTAFALALHAVSPSLSALHASHLRVQGPGHPLLTSLTCIRCGHSPVRVRSVRNKGNPSRIVQRTCGACQLIEAIPAPRGGAAQLESTRKRRKSRSLLPPASPGPSSVISSPGSTPAPTLAVPARDPIRAPSSDPTPKRPKKKSGLQEMLARNRERQEKQTQDTTRSTGGLSSFLGGL